MNLFVASHQQWIKDMTDAGVDFIVIGGYSVIFHGYKRTTGDMDIWLKPDNENKKKLVNVLRKSGFEDADVAYIAGLNFEEHLSFSVGAAPEKIDFLTRINLLAYDDAQKHKIVADVDGLKVPFLHLNDLVLSKMNTGRPQDKADIEMLQHIEKTKRG